MIVRQNLLQKVGSWLPSRWIKGSSRSLCLLVSLTLSPPSVTGYEAREDDVSKEPLLTDLDEPPPAPVAPADPAPMASITLECSDPAYTQYPGPEPGRPACAGGGCLAG